MTVAESEIVADIPVEAALPGKAKYGTCIACHGANGGGGIGPALAGQDVEYLVGRLNSYRAKEQVGPMSSTMYPMAAGLSDQDILDLAEYATSL
jgi:cytochrome c